MIVTHFILIIDTITISLSLSRGVHAQLTTALPLAGAEPAAALWLLLSMVPIFRSCLIEDDLLALMPHADGLFQFSI